MKRIINRIVASFDMRTITDILEQNRRAVIVALISMLFIDSFFGKTSSDLVTFGVLFLYISFSRVYQWRSKTTFLICLGLLVAMFISFVFSYTSMATEKLAVWMFLFIIVGIIQEWRE